MLNQYSNAERNKIDIMKKFAKMIIEGDGMTYEEVAAQENVTIEYVASMIEKLKDIDFRLHCHVLGMKYAKIYLNEGGERLNQIAAQDNMKHAWLMIDMLRLDGVNSKVAFEVQKKLWS